MSLRLQGMEGSHDPFQGVERLSSGGLNPASENEGCSGQMPVSRIAMIASRPREDAAQRLLRSDIEDEEEEEEEKEGEE